MASQIAPHLQKGLNGENLAAEHLQKKGYTILRRNFRYKRAEVDIIARKDDVLVFVEVKTRSTEKFGFPEEAVGAKKEQLLLTAAEAFIEAEDWQQDVRFDIVSVTLTSPALLYHIEDAFH